MSGAGAGDGVTDARTHADKVYAVAGETVGEVAARMAGRKVSAVPVFATVSRDECLGAVDFSDVVALMLAAIEAPAAGAGVVASLANPEAFFNDFGKADVKLAIDQSGRDPLHTCSPDSTLWEVAQQFAAHKLRRMFVLDPDQGGKVAAIVSPSHISAFAMTRLRNAHEDPLLSITVAGVGNAPVVSVGKREPLLTALRVMKRERKSCVAVVEEASGSLAGSVSMSDIKLLFGVRDFSWLLKSTWEFIVFSRSLQDTEQFPFFGVQPDAKLANVVSKLLATAVHHVYVVDKRSSPVRVVGFTDVLRAFVSPPTGPTSTSSAASGTAAAAKPAKGS